MSHARSDDGSDASGSDFGLTRRLRERLRGALSRPQRSTSVGEKILERPMDDFAAGRGVSLPRGAEPKAEGSLLVWSERFYVGDGDREVRRELFGEDLELEIDARVDGAVFVDIETCGLADDPVFLVGGAFVDGGELVLEQYFAPDPTGEPELLRRSAEMLASFSRWVSFNGKSFDIPRLRRRARHHGVEFPEVAEHVDLLHEVRRRWRGELANCKLSTVESSLLGLRRMPGDVPGREVPERYWDFVEGGERRWIDPVIEHNRRDVAALVALLVRVEDHAIL